MRCVTLDNLDTPFYMLNFFRTPRISLLHSKTEINSGDTIFDGFFLLQNKNMGNPSEPSLIAVFTSTHNLSLEQKREKYLKIGILQPLFQR